MEPSTQKADSRSRRHSSVPKAAALTAHLVASLMASSAGWWLLRRRCLLCCCAVAAASTGGLSLAGASGSAAPLLPPAAAAAGGGPLRRPLDWRWCSCSCRMGLVVAQRCEAAAVRRWGDGAGAGRPGGSTQPVIALNWDRRRPGAAMQFETRRMRRTPAWRRVAPPARQVQHANALQHMPPAAVSQPHPLQALLTLKA